ncbi:hypothetical protein D1872_293820 [compost metagenome]
MKYLKENELDKIYKEIIYESPEIKTANKAYKLGAANTAKLIYDVLLQLENGGFGKVETKDLKEVVEVMMSNDDAIN